MDALRYAVFSDIQQGVVIQWNFRSCFRVTRVINYQKAKESQ
jgi:hypothetical protein